MTDSKITSLHLQRRAMVYIRQSTPSQVENHRESTRRQYALAGRARDQRAHPKPRSAGTPIRSRSSMKTLACPVPVPMTAADSHT